MKVLHVSGANSWGGNEQQLFNLVTHLNQIDNAIFGIENSPVEKHASKNQIPFFASKTPKLKSIKNISRFFEVIQQFKPEVIHLHTSCSLTLCFYASIYKSINPKVVFEKKGISNSSSFLSRLKYNSSSIDHIVCVSNYVKHHFKSMLTNKNQQKLCVVNDSFDLDFKEVDYHLSVDSSKFVVGNIANHSAAKDLDTFIEVADELINKRKNSNIHFYQVGSFSKLTPLLQQKIVDLNLSQHFSFLGSKEHAYNFNTLFDVFLLTSQREGGPTSLIEALYFETNIISTRVGIAEEVIEDGLNGYLVHKKDHKKMADCIEKLQQSPNMFLRKLSENKALVEQKFSSVRQAKALKEIYKS
ncbi:glycosyltransferase [Psychroflexus sp. ALD_RP9]|uniref:glycosyltransferase n=1 Tax=Psychroflexus sp. ALD_RP9 TaxID=2777186 RepID=UPI001A8E505B|nr:glycosyltransferase [Psychroflexus sp. ALD_RP9]QSS96938.1 glycosyltransferase [Psychroflexus sp. ALD_RP9]